MIYSVACSDSLYNGEPKRAGRHRSSCSFFLYLLTQTVPLSHTAAPAVNWLGAPRCLRQMKRCSEQEETTSVAKRSSSSAAPYHSFPPLAKTHSLRTSSSPQNARILGCPLQGDYVSDRMRRWFESKTA